MREPRPSEKAALERIGNRMETDGCDHCGARFGQGVPYFVGRAKRGGWTGRCVNPICHIGFASGPLFVGTSITGGDPWTEIDREWFAANPGRSWRLRWPMRGEVETMATDEYLAEHSGKPNVSDHAREAIRRNQAEGLQIAIAVYQFRTGMRVRLPFGYLSDDPPESYTDAAVPALMPDIAEFVERHRVLLRDDEFVKAQQQEALTHRLEAMAKIVKPQSP